MASVIRKMDESQSGCFKKTKQAKFSEKRIFLIPDSAYQGVRVVSFSKNLVCFVFSKHPF